MKQQVEMDTLTEDQAERLLRLLAKQLDAMNDHLAQIAGELHHIREAGLPEKETFEAPIPEHYDTVVKRYDYHKARYTK